MEGGVRHGLLASSLFRPSVFCPRGTGLRFVAPRSLADLRANPHRINLARVFLRRLGDRAATPIAAADLTAISQTLHLWNGSLGSAFTLDGEPVTVDTAVHPEADVLAVRICSAYEGLLTR